MDYNFHRGEHMKIYLDTGNIEEIKEAAATGLLDGVTTNPSLIAKEGKPFITVIKEIVAILKKHTDDFTVSAEVTALDAESMVKEGLQLAKLDKHVLVKIPLTEEGLKATKQLAAKKVKVNVTLCFSAQQALLAAKAGAYVISPFLGRLDDAGQESMDVLEDIKEIYDNYGFKTKILAASIRNTKHVTDAAIIGADIATIPMKVFKQLFNHPLTDTGLAKFMEDWKKYQDAS